jgi:ATP-binding cassette subfamily E protein 1
MSQLVRKSKKGSDIEKRIAIVNQDKCKPNSAAYAYLKKNSNICGRHCITIENKKVNISENSCMTCFNIAKRTPEDAVMVVKLPSNLTTDTTYQYGPNTFKLHGIPTPKPGTVLGLLGVNGIGKSTSIKILSGKLKPNFGIFGINQPEWSDIITYYRGGDLQNYFTKLSKKNLVVAIKPQLDLTLVRRLGDNNVGDILYSSDQRNKKDYICDKLGLTHLLGHSVKMLSGGELQRVVIATTILKQADVYLFDECSSFLDVKQRLIVADVVRSLVDDAEWTNGSSKYVIVVEHDLAILDYMSDFVQCLYGVPGAYGVVSNKSTTSNGINQFLAGYLINENMRFRPYELSFRNNVSDCEVQHNTYNTTKYPSMEKVFTHDNGDLGFVLNVEGGEFRNKEIICLLGQNGCGKSTFIEMLAGNMSESLKESGVSYKKQNTDIYKDFSGTVQDLLESTINKSLVDTFFRLIVLKSLNIEQLENLPVKSLSGGERQRVAITICLGTPAMIYLIDEPSADLDCEQRLIVARVIKRWIINHLGKSCFLIEHDFMMSSILADKIIVYEGVPGVKCMALSPIGVEEGFNRFLKQLNVTFRQKKANSRLRINKRNSILDRQQKQSGQYYIFNDD